MSEHDRERKRQRAARLLGELVPSKSRDDSDTGWSDPGDADQQRTRDAYLRGEVPPHHGQP